MKKTISLLLVTLFVILTLAGCGSKEKQITIAIPNDTTNEARALLLLEANGFIEVKDEAGIKATVADITSNPYNIKFNEVEAAQIPFETSIVMPEECGIENPDLICVLGNLLNNAQEASTGLKDGFISLEISYKEPYLSICVKNRVEEQARKEKVRRIAELDRGIGMSILEDMAQHYDGDFKVKSGEGIFQADLVLKGRSYVDDSDL